MTAAGAAPAAVMTHPRGRGLLWVVWRQHRIGLVGAVLVLGGFALLLLINGAAMHADVHRLGLDACGDVNSARCSLPLQLFSSRYGGIAMYLPRLLEFLPAVLGVFLGAPLLARELESGTYRFAWTQGRTRTQLLATKLAVLAAALVLLSLGFSALFAWWFGPFAPVMGRMESGQAYEIEGVVFAARTLFGFLLGALVGAVIRRTVPAMAATAALWLAAVVPSVLYLRPLIAAPVTVPAGSPQVDVSTIWVIDDWYQNAAKHRLSGRAADSLVLQGTGGQRVDVNQWLARHGWTEWVSFQPDSRFWHFQVIETSCYVVLAALLCWATLWWARRRVS